MYRNGNRTVSIEKPRQYHETMNWHGNKKRPDAADLGGEFSVLGAFAMARIKNAFHCTKLIGLICKVNLPRCKLHNQSKNNDLLPLRSKPLFINPKDQDWRPSRVKH